MSTIGDYCFVIALPWLVLSHGGTTVLLGTVLTFYGVPRTILIPFGGILSDKLGCRTLMLIADVVRLPSLALLGVFADMHMISILDLGPVAALIGVGAGLFTPASYAIIPSLLPEEKLSAGNALFSTVTEVASVLGPLIGAAIVASAGSAAAFYADSGTFAISVVTLALIPRRHYLAQATYAAPALARNGLTLLRQERTFRFILLVILTANIAYFGTLEVALPAFSHARFCAAGYGTLIACLGVGSILGTLASARRGAARNRPAIVSCLAFLGGSLGLAIVPFLGGLPGSGAAIFAFGAAASFGNVIFITMLQKWAPPALLGRVMSMILFASAGCYPVSVLIAGLLVHRIGATSFFLIAGTLIALPVTIAMTQRKFREFGMSDAGTATCGTVG